MRQGSSFLLHTNPTITKVAPSLLAVSSGAAFAIPASKRGITLLRDRVVSKPSRILAKLGGDGEAKPAGKRKFITREEEPEAMKLNSPELMQLCIFLRPVVLQREHVIQPC